MLAKPGWDVALSATVLAAEGFTFALRASPTHDEVAVMNGAPGTNAPSPVST
ncbi:hypothetical protein [Terriglobus roseus]|uniref:hypothetical protein n=1 Tax=Terriglobus roseus TaxID=392734 RepID=UPI00147D72F6|nr:hypothetical protein [Terriglobus roseus]